MIRNRLLVSIRAVLEREPYIIAEDFKVVSEIKDNATLLRITYLNDSNSYLAANIPHSKTATGAFPISIRVNPGELTSTQTDSADSSATLINIIMKWVGRLEEELLSAPEIRAAQQIADRLEEMESRLDEIPDTLATAAQIEQLHELLVDLEEKFRTQIDALVLSVEEKERKLQELERQFELLHKRASAGTVKQAIRAIVSRVYKVASDPDLPRIVENGRKIAGMLSGPDTAG